MRSMKNKVSRMRNYVESRVCDARKVQVAKDSLKTGSGREIRKERRMLPVRDAGHYQALKIVRNNLEVF
jgi:hypothetical protein